MIAFASMLVKPAEEAGMKVPSNPDKFDVSQYPHFHVFLNVQLGASMPQADSHWSNAKIIAKIPDEKIMKITYQELLDLGFAEGNSYSPGNV